MLKSALSRDGLIDHDVDYARVVSAFRILKNKNDLESYASIRQICEADGAPQHRYTNYTNVPPPPAPTFGGVPNRASASNGTSGELCLDM